MAKCDACDQEMVEGGSCSVVTLALPRGARQDRIPYGQETRVQFAENGKPCHCCGVVVTKLHHLGCDVEECIFCRRQLISCSCFIEGV